MSRSAQFLLIVLSYGLLLISPAPLNADGGGDVVLQQGDPAIAKANRAIQKKEWDKAIELLNGVVVHDMRNADAFNLLGYSERMRGNLEVAFGHYERALSINPEHRGAHEYIGEAYLMAGNLPKAEEHLARLDELCLFSCEEYNDLKAAITDYRQKSAK